jgi:hypothetical protein
MVVTNFRPRAAIFVTRSGSEVASMKSSMWSRSKRVGGVLAAVLGMMAAVAVDPGVATADDVAPGQHLSLSGQCTDQNPILATCGAVAGGGTGAPGLGGGTRVVCQSDGGCRYTVTASGQKQGEDAPESSGSWIRACAEVYPLNPKGPYDKVRLQCSEVSEYGPSVFNGTLNSGDQATLRASANGTNWQVLSVQADVDG